MFELDPDAKWIKSIEVHDGHEPTFLLKLARKVQTVFDTTTSRHLLGFDSVTKHEKLDTKDYLLILSCLPPKFLHMFEELKDWSNVTKDFVEAIYQMCQRLYKRFADVHGCSYMKAICYMKKEWVVFLNVFDQLDDVDKSVNDFVVKLRENLKNLCDDDYYTAFYVGETITLFHE